MKKTTRKKTRKNPAAKNSVLVRTTKKAAEILAKQKEEYPKLLSKNMKKLGFKAGRKEAILQYQAKYGYDAKARWENARRKAEKSCK